MYFSNLSSVVKQLPTFLQGSEMEDWMHTVNLVSYFSPWPRTRDLSVTNLAPRSTDQVNEYVQEIRQLSEEICQCNLTKVAVDFLLLQVK